MYYQMSKMLQGSTYMGVPDNIGPTWIPPPRPGSIREPDLRPDSGKGKPTKGKKGKTGKKSSMAGGSTDGCN